MDEQEYRVGFELVGTLPASAGGQPLARVQQVVTVPGFDNMLAALDDRGLVWLLNDGEPQATPFVDLTAGQAGFERPGGESGLRSIAFHPGFSDADDPGFGKFYLAYSATPDSAPTGSQLFTSPGDQVLFHDVVSEFTVSGFPDGAVDPGSGRELLRIEQSFSNHNFGSLAFDPSLTSEDAGYGLLHLSTGDGGGGNDPLDAASDLSLILGKILRIDPLGDTANAAYAVPQDNPFVGTQTALPEILAYGFRNPQTYSFLDGAIIAGDIGQGAREEIDLVRVGAHHGWDAREGTLGFDPQEAVDFQYPIAEYAHADIITGNAAIAGGFAYSGNRVPILENAYVFGNFPTGEMFVYDLSQLDSVLADRRVTADETVAPIPLTLLAADGSETDFADIAGNSGGRVDLRFGKDSNGEILAFSKQTGEIFRLTADPALFGRGLSESEAQTVAYLYEIALDRDGGIDSPGLNFWIDAREAGLSELALADAFLFASEFEQRFGSVGSLGDRELVDLLYRNTLGREGENAGIDFWTDALGDPGFSRAELLLAFATSEENTAMLPFINSLGETGPGFWEFA